MVSLNATVFRLSLGTSPSSSAVDTPHAPMPHRDGFTPGLGVQEVQHANPLQHQVSGFRGEPWPACTMRKLQPQDNLAKVRDKADLNAKLCAACVQETAALCN